ncbi:hypothetical protein FRAAL1511 [Frankia alni ACN14a]|uniref:Uncharacterized protein n=1 Tax=Frankia alni (strain DSM 45986 / CECT 9034 / ACN14a) TaxID=326424 RepID=Q0RQK7_FRAAA|nr:hypothetical protein FRAAL1511 [Frankia alni ACN14a]
MLAPRPPGSAAAFHPVPDGSVLPYLTDSGLSLLDEALMIVGGAVVAGRSDRSVIGIRYRNQPVLVDPATYRTAEQAAAEGDGASTPPGLDLTGGVAADLPGVGAWPGSSASPVRLLGGPVIAVADRDALVLALGAPEPGVVVLALPLGWLLSGGLDTLIKEIIAADRPVAIVLAHRSNPLDRAGTVAGLVALLRETRPVPIGLIRCDVSAIGAVAHGAALGAVGLLPSTRHQSWPGGGGRASSDPHLFVPDLLTYVPAGRLRELADDHQDRLLVCECQACDGRSLLRFAGGPGTIAEPSPGSRADGGTGLAAALHNLHATEEISIPVIESSPEKRAACWKRMCLQAVDRLVTVRERRGDGAPAVGAWLRQWCDLPA